MPPVITRIETVEYAYPVADVGKPDTTFGGLASLVYAPGETARFRRLAIRIHTDAGVTGAFTASHPSVVAGQLDRVAGGLIGADALERGRIWTAVKRSLRFFDQLALGALDIALWDLAGHHYGAPVHELLGTHRTRLPAGASTMHGQAEGGLDSPEAYADFAERCRELGYPAFKLHGFDVVAEGALFEADIEAVRAVGERVGDDMALMLDGSCKYETWGQALAVGRACDEYGYFWYEDPYTDGGRSQHGHAKLREFLDTPLLQGEMVRGLEAHADMIEAGATDFVRVDPAYDGGITGAMKIAALAEGHGLDVEYHSPGPARRQCMAATRNTNFYELSLVHPDVANPLDDPAYGDDYDDSLEAVDADGTVPVPDGPGLGVELDWGFIGEHAVRRRTYA